MSEGPYRVVLVTVPEQRQRRTLNFLCHKTRTIYAYWYRDVHAAEIAGAIADAARAEVLAKNGLPQRPATETPAHAHSRSTRGIR